MPEIGHYTRPVRRVSIRTLPPAPPPTAMIADMVDVERSEPDVLIRAARAAAAGGGAGILGVIGFFVAVGLVPCEELGCLGTALVSAAVSLVAVVIVAWIVLHLTGVRPAPLVAILGPFAALAVGRIGAVLPSPVDLPLP